MEDILSPEQENIVRNLLPNAVWNKTSFDNIKLVLEKSGISFATSTKKATRDYLEKLINAIDTKIDDESKVEAQMDIENFIREEEEIADVEVTIKSSLKAALANLKVSGLRIIANRLQIPNSVKVKKELIDAILKHPNKDQALSYILDLEQIHNISSTTLASVTQQGDEPMVSIDEIELSSIAENRENERLQEMLELHDQIGKLEDSIVQIANERDDLLEIVEVNTISIEQIRALETQVAIGKQDVAQSEADKKLIEDELVKTAHEFQKLTEHHLIVSEQLSLALSRDTELEQALQAIVREMNDKDLAILRLNNSIDRLERTIESDKTSILDLSGQIKEMKHLEASERKHSAKIADLEKSLAELGKQLADSVKKAEELAELFAKRDQSLYVPVDSIEEVHEDLTFETPLRVKRYRNPKDKKPEYDIPCQFDAEMRRKTISRIKKG